MKNLEIHVVKGDITQIPTNAIMTAINSGGLWFGGVDGAIQRVAGNHYHSQAAKQMPLKELQAVIAKGNFKEHYGKFNDIVFVVDDLNYPLNEVIYSGLEAAHNQNYKNIALPAMRMGVMAGLVEKTPREVVIKIREGVENFLNKYGEVTNLKDLTFVVYQDPTAIKQLEEGLL